jgi:hypothetical protein
MIRSHRALPYRCYRATNATSACIGHVPTVPTPAYRFVGQFANTDGTLVYTSGALSVTVQITLLELLADQGIVNQNTSQGFHHFRNSPVGNRQTSMNNQELWHVGAERSFMRSN